MKDLYHLARIVAVAAITLSLLNPTSSRAVPYASGVSESGGNVTFYLNEPAPEVKVVFSGPSSTLDLGSLGRGSHSFARGAATSYQIQVTKSAPPIWSLITEDTNALVQFFAPISVSINRNPGSTNFGRIYVLEDGGAVTGGRTTTEGIFVLNPDITDAFAQGNTGLQAGLTSLDIFNGTAGSDRYDPFQIEVGDDDFVYISDANDPRAGLLRVDAAVTTGSEVLAGIGNNTAPSIHTVVYGLHTKGSLAGGNLTIWGTDGQWNSSASCNSILRWDVGSGPLPHNVAPVVVAQPGPLTSERDSDIDVAPDGNIFWTASFDGGTGGTGVPAVQVFSPTGTLLWSSVISGTDVLTNAYSLEVSPDNTKLAIIRRDRQTWIIGLTNGPSGRIPDLSSSNLVATFGSTGGGNGRCVNWDLAGNLYVANRSSERLRVFSPGGTTTAITGSDGTFNITIPANTVAITNPVTSIAENSGTPLVYTVTRTGNTAQPLTVSFLFTGTASNGIDHTTFPTSITFPANVTTTNLSTTVTDDSTAELSETLSITVNSGTNYAVTPPGVATVTILDDETPQISGVAGTPPKLLESYAPSKVTVQLERRGSLTSPVTVNVAYSGAATLGADFNGPSTVTFLGGAGTTNITLTPVNDQVFEGDELALVSAASGSGYTTGSSQASVLIVDDEYPAGQVLFSDNFDTDSSALWQVHFADPSDAVVEFAYDYSLLGVPPSLVGGGVKGMRFRCGNTNLQINAISASPTNGNFSGHYRLKFDMWINYNGPMPDGGPGSTQNFDAGVGTAGDRVVWRNNPNSDGVWFTATGDGADGNTGGDYTAMIGPDIQNDDTGFYAAGIGTPNSGIRNGNHPFYSFWGGHMAPPAQVLLFPGQSGTAFIGNAGMAWHTVVITKVTNTVTWQIDGILVATVTNNTLAFSTNIFVGYQDLFAGSSVSDNPEMSFGLVDNLRVERIGIQVMNLQLTGGNAEIVFASAPAFSASAFKLQKASLVTGAYADDNTAVLSSLGGGLFKATTAVSASNTTQYYRILRVD